MSASSGVIRRVFVPRPLSQIMKEEAASARKLISMPASAASEVDQAGALDRYIARVNSLPSAPVIATELLSLFGEADRDIDRIVELIGLDQSLTAEVLKRCNSAYVGLAEPVNGMFEAVFQLGFYEVYCIVVASIASRSMTMLQVEGGFNTVALWQHSVATATAGGILAKRSKVIEAMGFTAGLLHDIGKLVFASVERVVYANLVRDAAASGNTLIAAETEAFAFDHAELGARLLEHWKFPENVCAAVRQHHSALHSTEPDGPLRAIVKLANEIAHRVPMENGEDALTLPACKETLDLLSLREADVAPLVEETRTALQQIETLLHIPI